MSRTLCTRDFAADRPGRRLPGAWRAASIGYGAAFDGGIAIALVHIADGSRSGRGCRSSKVVAKFRVMSFLFAGGLPQYIATYGYGAVGGIVALESMGIPLPGETALVAAGVVAGTTHALAIWLVIAAAAAGAILGDNAGFWLGRELGYRALRRFGRYVWLDERRIKLGQYLFLRHGGKVVFFGRFVSVLRELAAFLAGANHMSWLRFLMFNAAGAIIWALLYGLGASGTSVVWPSRSVSGSGLPRPCWWLSALSFCAATKPPWRDVRRTRWPGHCGRRGGRGSANSGGKGGADRRGPFPRATCGFLAVSAHRAGLTIPGQDFKSPEIPRAAGDPWRGCRVVKGSRL
jgi:membrane protein DedA with SNARE-associated domain